MEKDATFFETARKRKAAAESYWEPIYKEYEEDARLYADEQWPKDQLANREESGRPALTFNQVKQPVLREINGLRQNKPAIKINPRDADADAETAAFYEGKIRNIEYESHADAARSHAAKCAAIGGIGFYRVTTEYVDDDSARPSFEQDAFVRTILDPRMVLYDPEVERFDFSDARYCLVVPKPIPWETYRKKYPQASLADWDDKNSGLQGWAREEAVTVAEYWHIESEDDVLIQLQNGEIGYEAEFSEEELKPENVLHRRVVERKTVHFDLVNGVETLEETIWPGTTIPIVPVLGDQVIVEQKRVLAGMIRSARDAQILLNAYFSGEAEAIGLTNRVPYIGPRGSFKSDANWQSAHLTNPAYLEYDLVYDQNGQLVPMAPQRQAAEAAVAALSQASMQMVDTIKRAIGYADDVVQPSKQSDLSGVAIERRSMQTESANFHIADSLALAMWREGKIYLEILPAIHDTPKVLQVTNAAGDVSTHYVTQAAEDGSVPLVEGAEDLKHHRLDQGRYGVTVTVGPTYSTKVEEESDFLTQILGGDPGLVTSFLDLVFKLRGYPELEARAKLLMPAAVQQGGQAALVAQAAQGQQAVAENQMLKAQLAKVLQEQQADILKLRNNIELQTMKSQTSIIVADIEAKTKQTLATLDARMKAIETMWDKLQESEGERLPNPV
ncbi:MAG TPA: portal protein [Bryobacteraceae bacterium]